MKLAHLNVPSLFAGFNEFSNLIQELDLDLVGISETWLSNDVSSDAIAIPGYSIFRSDRAGRGGGVALYVKNMYKCQVLSFEFNFSNSFEHLWVKFKNSHRTFVIGVFYRPPHSNIMDCVNDLDNILSYIIPTSDEILCLGDININLFNINNPLSSCFDSFNFTQVINEPTRITSTTSTLLDPIFVSNKDLVAEAGTVNADVISDHRLVLCKLNLKIKKFKQKTVTYRDFSNFDHQDFLRDLQILPWHEFLRENDVNNKIDMFNKFLLNTFNIHAPLKTVRVSKPKAPWLTANIKLLMKQRDKALKKFKNSKLINDWEYYKQLRNITLSIHQERKTCILK